jgi:hypothetical protein
LKRTIPDRELAQVRHHLRKTLKTFQLGTPPNGQKFHRTDPVIAEIVKQYIDYRFDIPANTLEGLNIPDPSMTEHVFDTYDEIKIAILEND